MAVSWWYVVCAFSLLCEYVAGGAVITFQMIAYTNPGGRDDRNRHCDGYGWAVTSCDHVFRFCLDRLNGDSNTEHCQYYKGTTGEFRNQNSNSFGSSMQGLANPIRHSFTSWPGGVKLKVRVWDDDSSHSGHDEVDKIFKSWSVAPSRAWATREVYNKYLQGIRNERKTTLQVKISAWCQDNYYGANCDVQCIGRNDALGHYTCNPDTGAKVCIAGWEAPSTDCTVFMDDCASSPCLNGATCIDEYRAYFCSCQPGFEGEQCEAGIDECLSDPCANGGTCIDGVAEHHCICNSGYLGTNCDYHVCHVSSPCLNNGTCVNDGDCACPVGFVGDICQTNICDTISCENNSTCVNGTCMCLPGFAGIFCDVDICDYHVCHNGGVCQTGSCVCEPGWTGPHCESDINECLSGPCANLNTCWNLVAGYSCECMPAYTGRNCETLMEDEHTEVSDAEPIVYVTDPPVIDTGASTHQDHKDRSTNGLVIGLVCGIFFAILVVIVAIAMVYRHRKQTKLAESRETPGCMANFDNPLYHTDGTNANQAETPVPGVTPSRENETLANGVASNVYAIGHVGIYPSTPNDEENLYDHIGPGNLEPGKPTKPPLPDRPALYDSPRARPDNAIYDNPPRRYPPTFEQSQRTHDGSRDGHEEISHPEDDTSHPEDDTYLEPRNSPPEYSTVE